jgi:hypothetical protein
MDGDEKMLGIWDREKEGTVLILEQAKILIEEGLSMMIKTVDKNTGEISTAVENIHCSKYCMYQIYNIV